MMGILDKLSLGRPKPNPEAQEQLIASRRQYTEAVSRGPAVSQIGGWFERRLEKNHFGADVDITFTRRNTRNAHP